MAKISKIPQKNPHFRVKEWAGYTFCCLPSSAAGLLTNHILLNLICPKFQVLSSYFPEVYELLDEHWAKIVQKEKKIQLQSKSKAKICIDKMFAEMAVKNSGTSCLD